MLLVLMFWLFIGKAIGLPDEFLAFKEGSRGGGVIQVNEYKNSFDVIGYFSWKNFHSLQFWSYLCG